MRSLRDSVIVITGASSGIGRAAAHAFAERGARLVLAARRDIALEQARRECEDRGAQAIAINADVGDEQQVIALRDAAIEAFGRIDIWINNAGVSLFGRIEEPPMQDIEQVIRTNLFGAIHGARAVIPHFRRRRRGHLIIVSSVVSYVGQPFTGAYCASKFALRGLAESLRQELADTPGAHVSTLLPASIDTEIFQHAGNYTGRAVKPMDPVYPPEMVAGDIVRLARHPRREMVSGPAGLAALLGHRLAPGLAEDIMGRRVRTNHFRDAPAHRSSGGIHEPAGPLGGTAGGWRKERKRRPGRNAVIGAIVFSAVIGLGAAGTLLARFGRPRPAPR